MDRKRKQHARQQAGLWVSTSPSSCGTAPALGAVPRLPAQEQPKSSPSEVVGRACTPLPRGCGSMVTVFAPTPAIPTSTTFPAQAAAQHSTAGWGAPVRRCRAGGAPWSLSCVRAPLTHPP